MAKVNFLHVTDQHLNHPKVPTQILVRNLILMIEPAIKKGNVDYLLFTGDLFDRPTTTDSEAGKLIAFFMSWVLSICYDNNVKLRVLKGTSTHDANQNENWEHLHKGLIYKPDFKYFSTIGISEEDGFSMLHVPDNMASNSDKVKALVEEVLAGRTVDIALTHGMYTHHLIGAGFAVDAHDGKWYSSKVRCIIFNGHIHTSSLWWNILTGGSSDRNRHGEEEAKGIHLVSVDLVSKRFVIDFIKNLTAGIFTTLDVRGLDIERAIVSIVAYLNSMDTEDPIHLRLLHDAKYDAVGLVKMLKDVHPSLVAQVEFSTKVDSKQTAEVNQDALEEFIKLEVVPINRDTVIELLEEEYAEHSMEFDSNHRELVNSILEDM